MSGHTASIYSLAFSAESSLLVSGGADWTVRCWDVKSAGGSPSKPRENGTSQYTPLGLASNGAIVGGSNDEEASETSVYSFSLFSPSDLISELIFWQLSRLKELQ